VARSHCYRCHYSATDFTHGGLKCKLDGAPVSVEGTCDSWMLNQAFMRVPELSAHEKAEALRAKIETYKGRLL